MKKIKELYKKLCKKAIGYTNIIQDICNNDYTDKQKLQAIMSISNEYKTIFEKKEGEINDQ